MRSLVLSLRTRVLAGVVLTVVILAALPIVFTGAAVKQRESSRWVSHTYDVLRGSESVRAGLRELQVLAVGRRAAEDRRLDVAWGQVALRVEGELADLMALVSDNPAQQARAAAIRGRIRDWIAAIDAPGQGGRTPPGAIPDLILGTRGEWSTRAIEDLLLAFEAEERHLLELRLGASEEANRWNVAVIRAGSGLAIVAKLGFAFWLIHSLLRPIRELTTAARRIEEGNFDARVIRPGPDELGHLGQVFNRMAASLQKNAREREKRDVQAGVLRISEILSSTTDLPRLLDTALERILELSRCPAGAFFLLAPEEGALRMVVASGVAPGLLDEAVPLGEGVIGRAARSPVPLFVPCEAEATPIAIGHWLGPRKPAELAYLPLRSGPDLVGVLTLASSAPFDDRTRNVLWIVAGQLGMAIQNAMALQALRRQAVELESRNAQLAEAHAELERSNRELHVASRLKSEFLANMSHELRTPLTIILGFTNAVLRGTQGDLNPEQRGSLKRVYDNGRHLLELINDILDLSKIEAGQMELDVGPTDPRTLVESVGEHFRDLAGGKGLALRVEVDPGTPAELTTDESRLRQVLVNLAANAVKFTDRGEVVLAARRAGRAACEFEVRDTGPGIPREDIPRIFEQFRQLDGRTTRRAGGTGLGLSIVRRLVDLLGATLDVRSEVGVGSSFVIRIPLAPGESIAPAAPPALPPPREANGVVLSIDDDRDFQNLLRDALNETRLRLEVASSGREGLELAARLKPDVITLDVMLPDLDGWSVLSALKAGPETAAIPVIMLTVLRRKGLGLMLGATEFLTKPLDRDRLIQALHRVGASRGTGPVLIIDDDPEIRAVLAGELEAAGFEVRLAADGVEGLAQARREPPSAVILDLMMPNMDGFEVASALQADREATRYVPILVITAKTLTAEDVLRLNGGIEEIVQKNSMDVGGLVARLVTILRSLGISNSGNSTAPTNPRAAIG